MSKPKDEALYHPQYWHEHAKEARAIAETMVTADGRRVMRETAMNYDRMAALSERMRASEEKIRARNGGEQVIQD